MSQVKIIKLPVPVGRINSSDGQMHGLRKDRQRMDEQDDKRTLKKMTEVDESTMDGLADRQTKQYSMT